MTRSLGAALTTLLVSSVIGGTFTDHVARAQEAPAVPPPLVIRVDEPDTSGHYFLPADLRRLRAYVVGGAGGGDLDHPSQPVRGGRGAVLVADFDVPADDPSAFAYTVGRTGGRGTAPNGAHFGLQGGGGGDPDAFQGGAASSVGRPFGPALGSATAGGGGGASSNVPQWEFGVFPADGGDAGAAGESRCNVHCAAGGGPGTPDAPGVGGAGGGPDVVYGPGLPGQTSDGLTGGQGGPPHPMSAWSGGGGGGGGGFLPGGGGGGGPGNGCCGPLPVIDPGGGGGGGGSGVTGSARLVSFGHDDSGTPSVTLRPFASYSTITTSCVEVPAGVPTTCTAHVTSELGLHPTGTVAWARDPSSPGYLHAPATCTLDATGSCSVVLAGNHQVLLASGYRASYAGDYFHMDSSTTGTLAQVPRRTATSVSCGPNPVAAGFATTCTATVADVDPPGPAVPAAPAGDVTLGAPGAAGTFTHGGTCRLLDGRCSVTFRPGTDVDATVQADYDSGDRHGARYQTSTGSTPLAVDPAPPGAAHFFATGAEQTYTVPAGVTALRVQLIGGAGGEGAAPELNALGGPGALVETIVPVTPGQVLYLEVGGRGGDTNGVAGFNGGGLGGVDAHVLPGCGGPPLPPCAPPPVRSGGGGGATDIRTCPRSGPCATTTLGSRLAVAGGGGGAGSGGPDGHPADDNDLPVPRFAFLAGLPGTLGQGGRGGQVCAFNVCFVGGGGGGGGLMGGDGGAAGGGGGIGAGGGGGGSSYVVSTGQGTTVGLASRHADPEIAIVPIGAGTTPTVDHLVVTPDVATIEAGGAQAFTVEAVDAGGQSLGDVTADAVLAIGPDGSCAAASCTATTAGQHVVTATLDALVATAALTVEPGPLHHLGVSPSAASIAAGGSQTYAASAFDEFGNGLGDVRGGATFSIGPDGSCTGATCTATVAGPHAVTATVDGVSEPATLDVVAGELHHAAVSPSNATVEAGGSQLFTVEGFDEFGNSRGDVTDAVTFTISPDGSCEGGSCTATSAGPHVVTASGAVPVASASLLVVPAALNHVALSPATASIGAGGSQPYAVEGFDAFGNSRGDVTADAVLAIGPNGSCAVGSCSATSAGDHIVTASVGSAQATATLAVAPGPPDHLEIAPGSATVAASEVMTFSVGSADAYGNPLGDVTSSTTLSISPEGFCFRTQCVAFEAGPHTVTATRGGLTATATVTVTPGRVVSLRLTPARSSVQRGVVQRYTAEGFDLFGNSAGDVTSGATFHISPHGTCIANACTSAKKGRHQVTAALGTARSNTAILTVT